MTCLAHGFCTAKSRDFIGSLTSILLAEEANAYQGPWTMVVVQLSARSAVQLAFLHADERIMTTNSEKPGCQMASVYWDSIVAPQTHGFSRCQVFRGLGRCCHQSLGNDQQLIWCERSSVNTATQAFKPWVNLCVQDISFVMITFVCLFWFSTIVLFRYGVS